MVTTITLDIASESWPQGSLGMMLAGEQDFVTARNQSSESAHLELLIGRPCHSKANLTYFDCILCLTLI